MVCFRRGLAGGWIEDETAIVTGAIEENRMWIQSSVETNELSIEEKQLVPLITPAKTHKEALFRPRLHVDDVEGAVLVDMQ